MRRDQREFLKRNIAYSYAAKASKRGVWNCVNKKRYETKNQARNAASRFVKKFGWECEFYSCPHCKDYHLTTGGAPEE